MAAFLHPSAGRRTIEGDVMRWYGLVLAAWAAIGGVGAAAAVPLDDYLSSWSQNGLTIVRDGTSNTIQFGETTRFNVCFDQVSVPGGITDGTSNTIQFGETSGFFIIPGGSGPRVPITTITDGSSNTILFGETLDFCLRNVVVDDDPPEITDGTSNTIIIGEDSRFDICFSNVGITQTVTDGTSNTIQIGENTTSACYTDLQVAEVAEPPALAAAIMALALLPLAAQRRTRRRR
jgi:hypothetical protein